jgi:YfiH family protein
MTTTSTSPRSSSAERVARVEGGLVWRPHPPAAPDPAGAAPAVPTWPPVLVAEDLLERGVVAAFSGRAGARGTPPYDGLNLGLYVGDDPRAVLRSRRRVATVLGLAGLPWATVRQVHSARVIQARRERLAAGPPEAKPPLAEADGLVTAEPGIVLAVFMADCLPLLLADPDRRVVAAVHAGWRGLAAGVVEQGVAAFRDLGGRPAGAVALVGPGIGPCCYEVGPEVADAVTGRYPAAAATTSDGRPAIDTAAAAVQALERAGLGEVRRAAGECTGHQPERWFSYRRDGVTGRQAGLIALVGGGAGAPGRHADPSGGPPAGGASP